MRDFRYLFTGVIK